MRSLGDIFWIIRPKSLALIQYLVFNISNLVWTILLCGPVPGGLVQVPQSGGAMSDRGRHSRHQRYSLRLTETIIGDMELLMGRNDDRKEHHYIIAVNEMEWSNDTKFPGYHTLKLLFLLHIIVSTNYPTQIWSDKIWDRKSVAVCSASVKGKNSMLKDKCLFLVFVNISRLGINLEIFCLGARWPPRHISEGKVSVYSHRVQTLPLTSLEWDVTFLVIEDWSEQVYT